MKCSAQQTARGEVSDDELATESGGCDDDVLVQTEGDGTDLRPMRRRVNAAACEAAATAHRSPRPQSFVKAVSH
ncbi:unnamed protein product [Angiostrongylus costaricensis]|uniref:Uncharacterized protein n=1 Tax=Angiostrongylus costaricensis TaxID=334426 RepID=A0A0R3PMP6_ANGCS|nr:unnamed protein product [Angiostrongylus costaricensis]